MIWTVLKKTRGDHMAGNKIEPGEWVIFKGDEVVAHNKEMKIILEIASKYSENEVIISKEPASKYCYY